MSKAVRIRDFDREQGICEEWAPSLERAMRSTCFEAVAMLEEAETSTTDETLELEKFKGVDDISTKMYLFWQQIALEAILNF